MSYSYTLLDSSHNRSFFSCSVPPSAHENLAEDFQEISRIHFYFGKAPVDFMIDAVENATPEQLYIGRPQLAFSVKEVFELISYSHYSHEKRTLSYFIDKMFKDICSGTEDVIEELLSNPSNKNNAIKFNTTVQLFEEVEIVNQFLSKNNYSYNLLKTQHIINDAFKKVEKLRDVYSNLNDVLSVEQLKEKALLSVKEQLSKDFSFDMKELASIYDVYLVGDSWIRELNFMTKNIEEKPEGFKGYEEYIKKDQDVYVKNMRSLSMVLSNGIINYVRSFLVSLSMEKYRNQSMINRSCECYYSGKVRELEFAIENFHGNRREYEKELASLKNNKENFLKDKIKMKKKAEAELFNGYAIEDTLIKFLDNMKQDFIGIKKESLNADNVLRVTKIEDNKLTGKYKDKVIYAIPEHDAEIKGDMVIAAFSMNACDFEALSTQVLNNSDLIKEMRSNESSIKFTNFHNMTSFISSLKDESLQEFFLGDKNIEVESNFTI
ncbi:hypothetical protein [Klebsiella variicola]|uniref:hypothetical protein n=1 Tax=Klebsiella variicola TaxID=244366 RepID=UPI0019D41063|nr:hypothetical protein [Klebsiella variicola]MBN7737404.1 hypothetical protein [Klebsiella variicola]